MNACALSPRRPGDMPRSLQMEELMISEPSLLFVVSEEINDFSLRYLANNLYGLIFEREGKSGIEKAVLVLRNLIEDARREADLR